MTPNFYHSYFALWEAVSLAKYCCSPKVNHFGSLQIYGMATSLVRLAPICRCTRHGTGSQRLSEKKKSLAINLRNKGRLKSDSSASSPPGEKEVRWCPRTLTNPQASATDSTTEQCWQRNVWLNLLATPRVSDPYTMLRAWWCKVPKFARRWQIAAN